jgi:hypothetical protein
MNINDYLSEHGHSGLKQLAGKAGVNYVYLLQTMSGHRQIGLEAMKKLIAVEPRFTVKALRPDIYALACPETNDSEAA